MKLCLVAPIAPPNGGVANWEKIMREEIEKNRDIELIRINISPNKRKMDGRTVCDRIFYSGYVMLRAYFQLRKMVKKNTPDIVHITTSGGLGFFRDILLLNFLRRKKIPTVYHIHFGRTPNFEKKQNWQWHMLLRAMKLSSFIIAIDEKTYAVIIQYVKADKVGLIDNPINLSQLNNIILSDTPSIVFLGWVIKTKGIEELIEAFQTVKIKNPGLTLKLIGPISQEYKEYLKTKYETSGISFIGEVSHKLAMEELGQAGIFVLPSYTEGFPNVILEAMALRKPIIATHVGAIAKILSDDCGIVIEKQNADQLKQSIEYLISHEGKRKTLGNNARKRVESNYDISVVFEKYRQIWTELCKKN